MVPTNWFDNVNGLYAAFLHFNQDVLEINIYILLELWAYRTKEPVTRRQGQSMKSTIIKRKLKNYNSTTKTRSKK